MIIKSTKFRARVTDVDRATYEIVDNQFDYPDESFVSLEATFPEDSYHLYIEPPKQKEKESSKRRRS